MTYRPSLEEFKKKAGQGNLVPVYKEILADLDTPVSAYMKISQDSYSFLLESIEGGEDKIPECWLADLSRKSLNRADITRHFYGYG